MIHKTFIFQGFDSEYFFVDKDIFKSPLIGVQFFQPKSLSAHLFDLHASQFLLLFLDRGILLSINCHLWSQQTEGYSTFLQIIEIPKA